MTPLHLETDATTKPLEWNVTSNVRLDSTVLFGHGYDFFGLENLRREATGANGNYLAWPSNGKWSLYRDSDGALSFEEFASFEELKGAAEIWNQESY